MPLPPSKQRASMAFQRSYDFRRMHNKLHFRDVRATPAHFAPISQHLGTRHQHRRAKRLLPWRHPSARCRTHPSGEKNQSPATTHSGRNETRKRNATPPQHDLRHRAPDGHWRNTHHRPSPAQPSLPAERGPRRWPGDMGQNLQPAR